MMEIDVGLLLRREKDSPVANQTTANIFQSCSECLKNNKYALLLNTGLVAMSPPFYTEQDRRHETTTNRTNVKTDVVS